MRILEVHPFQGKSVMKGQRTYLRDMRHRGRRKDDLMELALFSKAEGQYVTS